MESTLSSYRTGNYLIELRSCKVTRNGECLKIRPKTFQLLALFLKKPDEIISKETFLNEVWDDVCVDDQVLFQSIKELRKIFSDIDPIKTFPRKGYSWVAPLEVIAIEPQEAPVEEFSPNKPSIKFFTAIAASILIIGISLFLFNPNKNIFSSAHAVTEGSIIVLPIGFAVKDNEHKWIRYGGMDQIIQRLMPTESLAVWQVEDVLEMFSRAPEQQEKYTPENIKRIFDDSGAALIAELYLAGIPGEYQLLYKLHRPNDVDKGVIFGDKPNEVFTKASTLIAKTTGQASNNTGELEQRSAFSNEMLAVAIEHLIQADFVQAVNYLRAIVVEEPNNLVARRHLAWSTSNLGNFEEANELLETLIADIIQGRDELSLSIKEKKHLGRARFVLAQNYITQEQYPEAMEILEKSFENTTQAFDWLYQGHIKYAMGSIHVLSLDYDSATNSYLAAEEYYEALQCPYGTADMNLSLADISFRQGKTESAVGYTQKALNIADESNLLGIKERANKLMAVYEPKPLEQD